MLGFRGPWRGDSMQKGWKEDPARPTPLGPLPGTIRGFRYGRTPLLGAHLY